MTIRTMGEFVDLPPGEWAACLVVDDGTNCILLVDDNQEPLLLKAIGGQLYLKAIPLPEDDH